MVANCVLNECSIQVITGYKFRSQKFREEVFLIVGKQFDRTHDEKETQSDCK